MNTLELYIYRNAVNISTTTTAYASTTMFCLILSQNNYVHFHANVKQI